MAQNPRREFLTRFLRTIGLVKLAGVSALIGVARRALAQTIPASYWRRKRTGIFVYLGYGSAVGAYSTTGTAWTASTLPTSSNWYSCAYNGTVFCAVSNNAASCLTSSNGIAWTSHTMPSSAYKIAAKGSTFCATPAAASTAVYVSTDGVTWTTGTMPSSGVYEGLATDGRIFCAINVNPSISAISSDGITWTAGTMPSTSTWHSITYNGTRFMCLQYAAGTASTTAAYSTDGLTWTATTRPSTVIYDMVWNGSVAVGPGQSGTAGIITADGITYTSTTMPASGLYYQIRWNGSVFVTASGASTNQGYYSKNGLSWTAFTMPASPTWLACATSYYPMT